MWLSEGLELFGIAISSPLAYLLVLLALRFTPISLYAHQPRRPCARDQHQLGAILGARSLGENRKAERLSAASGMVLGVALLALG